jgi:hypothetical protein
MLLRQASVSQGLKPGFLLRLNAGTEVPAYQKWYAISPVMERGVTKCVPEKVERKL